MKRVQKQFLTALVLVVVGVGAGLYTLREKVKTPAVRLRELRESQRLFRFGRIHVARGELMSTTATISFEADGSGGFRLTEPVAWPGDTDAFVSMITQMSGIAMERILTEDATAEDLQRNGLDRPSVTLKVELKDGKKHTLYVGDKNELINRYPVTDADKKLIGLIEPSGYWNYVRPVSEYRAKRVFATDADDLTEVHLKDGAGQPRVSLERTDDGWSMTGPDGKTEKADSGYVGLFLVRITKHLDADEYVTDAYDASMAAKYGLAPPALKLELVTKDERKGASIGFVRETDADESTALVQIDGTTTLIRSTDPTLETDLTKPARAFVDRTISRFDTRDVARLTLQTAGQPTVRAERNGENWRLVEPEARDAKPWKLDAMVRVLSLLRATRWYRETASAAELDEWRLSPWSRRLTVEASDGRVLADVVFGKYADDTHLFVKSWPASRVGVVGDATVRVIPERWQELVP